MKSKSKKLTTVLLIVATIISTCALSVFTAYAWDHPSVNTIETELYPDQSFTYSSSKMGPNMYFEGRNLSSLDRYIYYDMQYYNGKDWITVESCNYRITKGGVLNKGVTPTKKSDTYWRQVISCKHVNKGGRGVGWIW